LGVDRFISVVAPGDDAPAMMAGTRGIRDDGELGDIIGKWLDARLTKHSTEIFNGVRMFIMNIIKIIAYLFIVNAYRGTRKTATLNVDAWNTVVNTLIVGIISNKRAGVAWGIADLLLGQGITILHAKVVARAAVAVETAARVKLAAMKSMVAGPAPPGTGASMEAVANMDV